MCGAMQQAIILYSHTLHVQQQRRPQPNSRSCERPPDRIRAPQSPGQLTATCPCTPPQRHDSHASTLSSSWPPYKAMNRAWHMFSFVDFVLVASKAKTNVMWDLGPHLVHRGKSHSPNASFVAPQHQARRQAGQLPQLHHHPAAQLPNPRARPAAACPEVTLTSFQPRSNAGTTDWRAHQLDCCSRA